MLELQEKLFVDIQPNFIELTFSTVKTLRCFFGFSDNVTALVLMLVAVDVVVLGLVKNFFEGFKQITKSL